MGKIRNLLFIYFGFWWFFELNTYPGLHADEAWAGIKAYRFYKYGVSDYYGMTNYTGFLQPLISSFFFKVNSIGISELRCAGGIFNLLGLVILCRSIYKKVNHVLILPLLLFFAQSILILISPRVAWEVNTFTMFFLSLVISSILYSFSETLVMKTSCWTVLFLFINILGTYNHVIFSAFSVAAFVAVLLWNLGFPKFAIQRAVVLLGFNLLNVSVVFLFMKYDYFSALILFVVCGVTLEMILINRLSDIVWQSNILYSARRLVKNLVLIMCTISFLYFHYLGFFDVISNFKVFTQVNSWLIPPSLSILYIGLAFVFFLYLFFFLITDIVMGKGNLLFAIFLVVYMGLLAIYTTGCSFRYYLTLLVLSGVYIARKMACNPRFCRPLYVSLILMGILVNISFLNLFTDNKREIRPIDFKIGNGQIETSAHFLPNKPLMEFLQKNEIDSIAYVSNRYFLEYPILFYQLIKPWKQSKGNIGIIDYDYLDNHNGYMLYFEKTIVP